MSGSGVPGKEKGVGRGDVVELYGPSGSGKSEVLINVVARCVLPAWLGGEEQTAVFFDSGEVASAAPTRQTTTGQTVPLLIACCRDAVQHMLIPRCRLPNSLVFYQRCSVEQQTARGLYVARETQCDAQPQHALWMESNRGCNTRMYCSSSFGRKHPSPGHAKNALLYGRCLA